MLKHQDECRLFETRPAAHFNEAYPIGNGRLGGMVYGTLPTLRLGLNLDELWSGGRPPSADRFTPDAFYAARERVLAGDYAGAERLLTDAYARYDSSDYLPLGDLYLAMPEGVVTDYRRTLELPEATAGVSFALDGNPVSFSYIASYPDQVIALSLTCERPLTLTLSMTSPLSHRTVASGEQVCLEGVCPWRTQRWEDEQLAAPEGETVHFTALARALTDGRAQAVDDTLSLHGVTRLLVLFTACSSFLNGEAVGRTDHADEAEGRIAAAAGYTAQELLARHVADFRSYFDRVELTLDGPDRSDVPTSERLLANAPEQDPHLVSLAFHYGRYLLIAGSREGSRALNLQGIWNDKVTPPWGSEYTANINLEMNYWPVLSIGCPELMEPLETLLATVARTGRDTARQLYGAQGICAHHNLDIFGFSLPVSGEACWSFFPLSFAWLLRAPYEKYRYTGDVAYLRALYPLLADSVHFLVDCLVDDGRYWIFAPATSAENVYGLDGQRLAVARSTAFFGAIVRDSFDRLLSAAEVLGCEDALTTRVRQMRPRLLPPLITEDGRIAEWYFGDTTPPVQELEVHHRHLSHLYDLYPARAITASTPALWEAARRSLDVRGDDATGWSLGWKLCCRAYMGDAEATERLLRLFLRPVAPQVTATLSGGGVYPNLFCAHPPFQIDGNFALVAGVIELLVSEMDGEVRLLPALPPMLRRGGELSGVSLPGGRRVHLAWRDGELLFSQITEA